MYGVPINAPPVLPIHCPVCRSAFVETVADLPAIKLYKSRVCHPAFTIVPPTVDAPPS
jgi:hypothetical protein